MAGRVVTSAALISFHGFRNLRRGLRQADAAGTAGFGSGQSRLRRERTGAVSSRGMDGYMYCQARMCAPAPHRIDILRSSLTVFQIVGDHLN
jgi:hypothetical protein